MSENVIRNHNIMSYIKTLLYRHARMPTHREKQRTHKRDFHICDDNAPSKSQRLYNIKSNTRHGKPLLSCWLGLLKRLPKYYKLLLLPLIVPGGWKVSPYSCRYDTFQIQRPEALELQLIKKPPHHGLYFMGPEGTTTFSIRVNQPAVLWTSWKTHMTW